MTLGPVLTVMKIEPVGLYRLGALKRYKPVGSISERLAMAAWKEKNMTVGPVLTVMCMSAVQK